jgi:small-conductance mechanosensitive channel
MQRHTPPSRERRPPRGVFLTAALIVALAWTAGVQTQTQSQAPSAVQRDFEADAAPAAVHVEGEPIIWITAGLGPYSPQFRAARVEQRLDEAVHDRTLQDLTVTTTEVDNASELRVGQHLLMMVTQEDAASVHAPRASLARQYAHSLEAALRTERQRYAPTALARAAALALVSTAFFAAFVWLLLRLSKSIRQSLRQRLAKRLARSRVGTGELVPAEKMERILERTGTALRILLMLVAFNVYLTYVLGLFPWTRAASHQLLQYAVTPVRSFGIAFVDYLPKLLFLAVVIAAVYVAIRLVSLFFGQIERGRLVLENFPAEWANPTNKIVRVLLIAFGIVIAFPYLPASQSPAFTGVSVFVGVLVSLSSSSALSNIIAGIVLTYTGAFRLGDRVRIGDTFGDIVDAALLATRVRTIKNEEVTIPNGLVLGSAVTNYTREALTRGLILHTSVTIGYDVPWTKVHSMLIEAALATPDILATPAPFVWQTALNDFNVTYEINAYTAKPETMPETYSALHSRIQDVFFTAGVEIMSPQYTSVRDGSVVAMPEANRPQDARPKRLQVETIPRDPAKSHGV